MAGNPTSQFAQFSFGGGMNEATDARLLEPPFVVDAINVRIPKVGQYEKRPGTSSAFSSLVDPSWASYSLVGDGVVALSSMGAGGPLLYADKKSFAVSSTARSALLWRGHTPLGEPRKRTLWANTQSFDGSAASAALTQFANVDCAAGTLANTKTCVAAAWTNATNVTYFGVWDAETWSPIDVTYSGSTYHPILQLTGYAWPRLMWLGNDLYCLAHARTTNNLALLKLTTSTWTWSVIGNVVTDARNSAPRAWFDVCPLTSTTFALAYQTTANALKVLRITASTGAVANTVTSAEPAANLDAIGVHGTSGENIWVTYVVNATGQARVTVVADNTWAENGSFPVSVAGGGGNQAFCSGSIRVSSTKQALFFQRYDGSTKCSLYSVSVTTGGLEDLNPCINDNVMMTGKPFIESSRVFVPAIWGGSGRNVTLPWGSATSITQFSSGLLQFLHDRPTSSQWALMPSVTMIARVATGPGMCRVGSTGNLFAPCSVVALGSTYYHVWPEIRAINGGKSAARETLELHAYDTSTVDYLKAPKLGPCNFAGGCVIDPAFVYEHTPISRPETITVTDSAGAGTLAAATYNYRVIYAFTTASGQIVRSAPSEAKSYAAPGLKYAVVSIPLPPATSAWRPDSNVFAFSFYAEVYRTTDDSSGPYYYVGRTALTPSGVGATYNDDFADATISVNPTLYTGDVSTSRAACANVSPPTFVQTIVHKDRLFGLCPDRRTIYFSDKIVSGEVPSFHDEMTLYVDDDLTALFSLDGTIGACSKTAFYAMQGDGPSNKFPAADSDYQGFQRVATDVGASSPKSLCLTPDGIVYRTSQGLNVFTRGGQVVPFGLEVQGQLATHPSNTSIVVHPSQRWLYVACESAGGLSARLVYDYRNKAWTRDDVRANEASERMTAQCVHDGTLYFVAGSNGTVWKEDTTTYLDASNWVTMSVTLAPFKASGPQGWQEAHSFLLLGERYTAHGLSTGLTFDHGSTRFENKSVTDSDVTAFVTSPVIQLRRSITNSEHQSVRLAISDVAPTVGSVGTGQGGAWVAYGFDHFKQAGPAKLPPAQQR